MAILFAGRSILQASGEQIWISPTAIVQMHLALESISTMLENGRVESEEELWQAAFCIRLFFEFHSPVARVLGARWDQIDGEYWYPYFPDEKVYWYESRERIDSVAASLLKKIRERNRVDFPESVFWFPRPSAPATRCISSVYLMWRKALVDSGMPHCPLWEFARSYRDPNCPSYMLGFLRQYGERFREIGNTAELSKRLLPKKKH
jgi:hypothetical protein